MYVPIYNFMHVYVPCTYKCVGTSSGIVTCSTYSVRTRYKSVHHMLWYCTTLFCSVRVRTFYPKYVPVRTFYTKYVPSTYFSKTYVLSTY